MPPFFVQWPPLRKKRAKFVAAGCVAVNVFLVRLVTERRKRCSWRQPTALGTKAFTGLIPPKPLPVDFAL